MTSLQVHSHKTPTVSFKPSIGGEGPQHSRWNKQRDVLRTNWRGEIPSRSLNLNHTQAPRRSRALQMRRNCMDTTPTCIVTSEYALQLQRAWRRMSTRYGLDVRADGGWAGAYDMRAYDMHTTPAMRMICNRNEAAWHGNCMVRGSTSASTSGTETASCNSHAVAIASHFQAVGFHADIVPIEYLEGHVYFCPDLALRLTRHDVSCDHASSVGPGRVIDARAWRWGALCASGTSERRSMLK